MTDQVSNDNTPALGTSEHDRQMADKFRAQSGDLPPEDGSITPSKDAKDEKPERPAHVPEKFWDAEKGEVRLEELTKSYTELEKKASQKPVEKPAKGADGTGNDENVEGDPPNDDNKPDPVAEAVKGFTSLREQATTKLVAGEALTDEMYDGFEKHGLSREDVDAFIAGQEAIGTLAKMEVHNAVGGEKQYNAMIEWAKANFDKAEIEVYDRDIYSSDSAVRLTAARGLAARYAQAVGNDGASVTDGQNTKRGADAYGSGAEMRRDMRDPKYKDDPAFREQVARKAAAARAAGIDLSL